MMNVNEDVQSDVGMYTMMRLRAVLMGQLSDKARRASGWPLLSPVGCNRTSPIFQFHAADIKAFDVKPAIPGARAHTVYKKLVYFNENSHRTDFKTTIQVRKTDGTRLISPFIGKGTREALQLPK